MDLPAVCQKLDEVAMSFFEILEEMTERKRRLQDDLREGFLSLSKARYSMGSRSVGSLQYSTNMRALATIQVSESNDSCTFCADRRDPTKKRAIQEGSDSSIERSSDNQVRRRKGDDKEISGATVEERVQDLSLNDKEEGEYQDPMKWFGILVPAALRQGQSSFIQAVEQSVEIASLQNRLTALQREYRTLKDVKNKLKDREEAQNDHKTDGPTEEGEPTG